MNAEERRPRHMIPRGPKEPALRVVDLLPSGDPQKFAILVLEEG